MRRRAALLGVVSIAAVLASTEARSDPSRTAGRQLVGSYDLITRIEKPRRAVGRGTLVIDTYTRASGAIAGHGFASNVPLSMTGTVHGSTITMRVINVYGVASDLGRIYPNGAIKGRITAKAQGLTGPVAETGTWVMTPSLVAVAKVGLTVDHLGHQGTDVSVGIEIRNLSRSRDAENITLDVRPLTRAGKLADNEPFLLGTRVRMIPAGQTFYFGGGANLLGDVHVAKLRVTVVVGSTPPKRYVLPPVTNVHADAASGRVTATMTNPYRTSISPFDLSATAVFYDRSGGIIGGTDLGSVGDLASRALIKPGQRAPVEVLIPFRVPRKRVASARVTVAPS